MTSWINLPAGQLYMPLALHLNHPNTVLLPQRHPSTPGNGVPSLSDLRSELIMQVKTLTYLAA
jgi:hypothetical protein